MENLHKIILNRGAEGGAVLGAMFVAMFAAAVSTNPFWTLALLILFVAVPVVAWKLLRRSYVASKGLLTFSAIWLQGILMFIGGSLMLAVASYVFFRWLQPDFVTTQLRLAIDLLQQHPEREQMARDLTTMLERNLLPRPIEFAMSIMWAAAFSGSLLSLLLSAIAKGMPLRADQTYNSNNDDPAAPGSNISR